MTRTLYFSNMFGFGSLISTWIFSTIDCFLLGCLWECRRRADSFHNFQVATLDEDIVNLLESETRGFGKDDVDDGNKYEVLQSHTVSCYFLFRSIWWESLTITMKTRYVFQAMLATIVGVVITMIKTYSSIQRGMIIMYPCRVQLALTQIQLTITAMDVPWARTWSGRISAL